MMRIVNAALAALFIPLAALAETRPDATLVMVDQPGCIYCARWDAEIAPIWPKTPEGQAAPLRRVDLRDLPEDLTFASPPRLTPTFVVAVDGEERARMEGYAGDEFFWPLIADLLRNAGVPVASAAQ